MVSISKSHSTWFSSYHFHKIFRKRTLISRSSTEIGPGPRFLIVEPLVSIWSSYVTLFSRYHFCKLWCCNDNTRLEYERFIIYPLIFLMSCCCSIILKKKHVLSRCLFFPPNFLVAADVRTSIHSILLALHLAHVSLPASTLTIWREEQTDLHLKCSYLWRPLLPFRQPKSTNWKGQECRGRTVCVCVCVGGKMSGNLSFLSAGCAFVPCSFAC